MFTQATPRSIVAYLRREEEEAAALKHLGPAESEKEAVAYCFLFLPPYAHRREFSLLDAVERKCTENRLRRWGTPDAEGVVEHVRDEEG